MGCCRVAAGDKGGLRFSLAAPSPRPNVTCEVARPGPRASLDGDQLHRALGAKEEGLQPCGKVWVSPGSPFLSPLPLLLRHQSCLTEF